MCRTDAPKPGRARAGDKQARYAGPGLPVSPGLTGEARPSVDRPP